MERKEITAFTEGMGHENKVLSSHAKVFWWKQGVSMGIMTVYHGGYEAIETLEIHIGCNTKDFGNGFCCTVIKERAQRWAKSMRW